VDTGDQAGNYVPVLAAAYEKAHPKVDIQYRNLDATSYNQFLQLAFQSGTMPDIFTLPQPVMTIAQAVKQGHLKPLDTVIPDIEAWKKRFPAGSFRPGLNVVNGKTYTFPMLGRYTLSLMTNRDYCDAAGIDPEKQPLTLDTFRSSARKLTKTGAGKYYGFVLGGVEPARWEIVTRLLAMLQGASGGDFNYSTGTYNFTSEGYANAVETLLAMKKDGSFDPSTVSLSTLKADASLPAGQNAMTIRETGVIPTWKKTNPNFNFGIADLPAPKGSARGYVHQAPNLQFWFASSKTQDSSVVGDVFSYLGTVDGQKNWQIISGGVFPALFPEAQTAVGLDPRLESAFAFYKDAIRLRPTPETRNPDVNIVTQLQKPISPAFGSVIQGLFTGQLDDQKKALQSLQDRSEQAFDNAIKAARAAGANVSRSDYVFKDWNPAKDYNA
jgi:multiple sugar transport system substrate-binding protein